MSLHVCRLWVHMSFLLTAFGQCQWYLQWIQDKLPTAEEVEEHDTQLTRVVCFNVPMGHGLHRFVRHNKVDVRSLETANTKWQRQDRPCLCACALQERAAQDLRECPPEALCVFPCFCWNVLFGQVQKRVLTRGDLNSVPSSQFPCFRAGWCAG